jgi:pyruvate,water dikinase
MNGDHWGIRHITAADDNVDPLHGASYPNSTWSTTNVAEALPGVLTPLSWTLWGPALERAGRRTFHALGALARRETEVPTRVEERYFGVFHGRPALRVDFFCLMGDRLPGTSGAAVAEHFLASVPPGFVSRPDRRYYPLVAARLPAAILQAPGAARRARAGTERWWRTDLARIPTADRDEARGCLATAVACFEENAYRQGLALFTLVHPLYDQLTRLAAAAGGAAPGLMGGYGAHEETQMVVDLWACSRGRLDLDSFLASHGFHGPREGEVSAVVWREDPSPLLQILEAYVAMGESADPMVAEASRAEERRRAERDLIAGLPASRRPWGRMVLRLARRYVPLRAVCKVAYLQSVDVARASARRLGACLAAEGVLEAPEDVFFLTVDELGQSRWDGAKERVEVRRARYETNQRLELPITWQGMPEPRPVGIERSTADDSRVLEGVAASPGVAEGWVRVVTDTTNSEMEPGEILVAHTTDPSWASVLFLASALITDVGGLLSHTAVVARELGVPCVANTRVATQVLRTGDRCRVDGTTGRVEVLERAEA